MPRARILGLAALLAIPFVPAATGRASRPSLIVFSADRAPLVSSVIYRLDPNGQRVDLSRSGFDASDPVVSPDGKKVAFFSYRNSPPGQGAHLYEVGIDGTKLRNMAPSLTEAGDVAWQPHGDRLAAIAQSKINGPFTLWILRWGHKPIRLVSGGGFGGGLGATREPSWSPDGRVLVVWSGFKWRAFSPSGRRLWTHEGNREGACCDSSWSANGLFAVTTEQKVRVYDESGRTQFTGRLPTGRFGGPSWSPDGREVGVATGKVVEVWTARGRLVLRKRVPILGGHKPETVWASDRRLVVRDHITGRQEGVDVSTGRFWNASSRWFDPRSADGKLAAVTSGAGADLTIRVAPVGGGATKVYGAGTDCGAGAWVRSLQFVGHSRSLVYESECNPGLLPSDLFAMAPDGTDLHEISAIQPNAAQPALSPDGTKITYVWAPSTGVSGPEIRVANVDGTSVRVLTTPTSNCTYAASPTWSPDGETILYAETTIGYTSDCPGAGGSELYTVPAAGGAPHDLGVVGAYPTWGPTRIAYTGAGGLTTANPDGSDPAVVATLSGTRAWSPDGRLAYTTFEPGTTVVVGSTQVQLPFVQLTSLAWAPDGTRFVVAAQKTKTAPIDVYSVRIDGTDPVRLTTGYNARSADWR